MSFKGIPQEKTVRLVCDSERRLLDIINSVPSAIFQFALGGDGSKRFNFVSRAFEQIYGLDPEIATQNIETVLGRIVLDDRPLLLASLTESARTMSRCKSEFRIHRDGKVHWCMWSTSEPSVEADGTTIWNGYLSDISGRKQLEAALQEAKDSADRANRAKGAFLAKMSHEIRTPMNGVLGMLELLGLTGLSVEQRTTLEHVDQSGRELLRILDDILDFSKIEAGKLEIRPERTSITDEVIDNVFQAHRANAYRKGLTLVRTIDPRISPVVRADPLRLRQILHNFVSNALKFTAHGTVEIMVELLGRNNGHDRLRFSVIDTGIGVAPENQQKLFQPFVQAETDTTRRFGGTGLGLTICKALAESMNGTVEMVSALGTGTTMSLTLDLAVASPLELSRSNQEKAHKAAIRYLRRKPLSPEDAHATGKLVLVVDDHPTNLNVMVRQLNTLRYAVETANNGTEALKKWKAGSFAMVITDCEMPEMDGYELARSIRRHETTGDNARVPIIACTANAYASEIEMCLAAGMDDYLAKPTAMLEMAKMLDKWLPHQSADTPAAEHCASAQPSAGSGTGSLGQSEIPLDWSQLARSLAPDATAMCEIIADFRIVNSADAEMLQAALSIRDIARVTSVSHSMKGASRVLGAIDLATACEDMEYAARANDWHMVEKHQRALFHELERLNKYLDAHASRLPGSCKHEE